MKKTCTRRFQFCAGHRVYGHENKCANLHGHNYVAYVTVGASGLDSVGRVIDFSCIKEKVGGWIDENWDHGLLLKASDPLAKQLYDVPEYRDMKRFLMEANPTAENMAEQLFLVAAEVLPSEVSPVKVVLWETENCYAEYIQGESGPSVEIPTKAGRK